ncbi:MAG: DNA repair protein RecO [Algicola sp.]|nr:DNA repair protein RecO [Algicola sp.]
MLVSTKAIVLSKLKYRDNDLIVKCYTQKFGAINYIIRGVYSSRRASQKAAYYQLLSQLQLEAVHKENKTLQSIKDVKSAAIYTSMHTHVLKSAIVMFLAEVLANVLNEEEKNSSLYEFLEHALLWLDVEDSYSNFHLVFLLKLTKHLGFFPDVSNIHYSYFNLQEGSFQEVSAHNTISGGILTGLKTLLGINFDALNTVKISLNQRQHLLEHILMYYRFHVDGFKQPKSLDVFNQVFN